MRFDREYIPCAYVYIWRRERMRKGNWIEAADGIEIAETATHGIVLTDLTCSIQLPP